jgi:TonB family protein
MLMSLLLVLMSGVGAVPPSAVDAATAVVEPDSEGLESTQAPEPESGDKPAEKKRKRDPDGPPVPTDPLADAIFQAFGAPRELCMRAVEKRFVPHGADLYCGFPPVKSKQFMARWTRTFPQDIPQAGVEPISEWMETPSSWHRRYYEIDGVPSVIAYGGRQAGLVVAYFRRYPKCEQGDEDLPRAGRDGVTRPERVPGEWVEAMYPLKARQRRVNGMVLMRAVIDTDGEVEDLCVLDAYPNGYGFEQSALEAATAVRYAPAEKDGTPVRVQMPVVKTYAIE